MRNYHILRADSEVFSVMLNPAAYEPKALTRSKPDPHAVLAFDTNYNWLGMPIGYLRVDGYDVGSISIYLDIRPVLAFDEGDQRWRIVSGKTFAKDKERYLWAFQAGPTLVRDGSVCIESKEQRFRADALRRTAQVAVGTTMAGKLIVSYSFAWSLDQIASYLRSVGCVQALKMDGGSAAMLSFRPDTDHNVRIGNTGRVPVGVQFLRS